MKKILNFFYPNIIYIFVFMFTGADILQAVANRHFKTLKNIEPLKDAYGDLDYNTVRFGIVIKVQEKNGEKLYALKCFNSINAARALRLQVISEFSKEIISPYLVPFSYHKDELTVTSTLGVSFPTDVLLMEWIDGITMGKYLKNACETRDITVLKKIPYAFDQLALWLLVQPFAHGDLKHDNILVRLGGCLFWLITTACFYRSLSGRKPLKTARLSISIRNATKHISIRILTISACSSFR
ncbi:MAG: protein kinase family protein [Bacteroidia bacterium]|nr:protein kinase family protein [Bacteroidia bacterium]